MNYSRPCIKDICPIYKLSDTMFRIGAQINITTEFNDSNDETGASFTHKLWPRFKECPACGHGNSNDWEIFSHYG
ncbi:TPA: hypothetical protein TVE77_000980 [Streptococcus equi subsp. zooepidemicus]|uniref:Molybdopterin biosynthesis protein n=1 Tax=Streptococcus equi subsp. zooepidemicus TaxID=40041 RepID=A0A7Z8ZWW0_STRSZ|nr:hypothetical protein [Streptococcus equi]KIQ76554.1 hypothetical protein QQ41_01020 [Streptococcus equi subsp. zooepidemicus]KIS09773.1 molybdopterin biosynthesis protein [Streptococcus equi subsp. zooepidemicus Sz57]MCD3367109.1 hypothetical protein [Streptococcus equi subsp. zooepidemicus]MCD3385987.1 hypothetical protein [Streptococcus equi subsp. zooepidemicus]MCD3416985.1 hypothetical protein [Streptococcus equi subsp. zooepidemicus]